MYSKHVNWRGGKVKVIHRFLYHVAWTMFDETISDLEGGGASVSILNPGSIWSIPVLTIIYVGVGVV